MKLAIPNLLKSGLLLGLMSVGVYACGQSNGGGNGTGGSSEGGSGGTGSGGHTAGSGGSTSAGGTTTSGGTTGSGGTHETGGTVGSGGSNSGGTSSSGGAATGGSSSGGAGGSSSSTAMGGTGGMLSEGTGGKVTGSGGKVTGSGGMAPGSGGKGGTSGPTDGGPAAGGTGGGTSSGSCQKGQVKPAEVVIMGESFYAMPPEYNEKRIESDAQAAGALASGATYRNVAESGQPMSYIVGTEWTNATKGGATVKVVIMDGGGIDCLTSGSCPTCASQFTTLLGKMATEGVQDVIYTRYPEPGAPPGSNASLKACLDSVMPTMQPVCENATGLKCHWVDLRPVFVAGDTTDGLHPTQTGGDHVGDAIWSEMVKDCIAQ